MSDVIGIIKNTVGTFDYGEYGDLTSFRYIDYEYDPVLYGRYVEINVPEGPFYVNDALDSTRRPFKFPMINDVLYGMDSFIHWIEVPYLFTPISGGRFIFRFNFSSFVPSGLALWVGVSNFGTTYPEAYAPYGWFRGDVLGSFYYALDQGSDSTVWAEGRTITGSPWLPDMTDVWDYTFRMEAKAYTPLIVTGDPMDSTRRIYTRSSAFTWLVVPCDPVGDIMEVGFMMPPLGGDFFDPYQDQVVSVGPWSSNLRFYVRVGLIYSSRPVDVKTPYMYRLGSFRVSLDPPTSTSSGDGY